MISSNFELEATEMNMAEESVAIGMRDTVCKEPSGSALFLTF
jgi:hypothetical protein